jgi:hypothetical protein
MYRAKYSLMNRRTSSAVTASVIADGSGACALADRGDIIMSNRITTKVVFLIDLLLSPSRGLLVLIIEREDF